MNQAHRIASSIYEENKNKISQKDLKYLIVTALKNISYDDKRSYFYINTMQGKAVLFKHISKLNMNKSLWNFKDVNGKYAVRNHIRVASSIKEEGFVTNYFEKPDLNDKKEYPKLSYIKYFKPLGWYIGLGEYLDDAKEETKKEILNELASIRYGKSGYIFVNSFDMKPLVYKGIVVKTNSIKLQAKSIKLQKVVIKNKNGIFIYSKTSKLNSKEKINKMTYIDTFASWRWIIGTGVYLDDLENEILRKENLLKENINNQLKGMLLIMFILIFIIYLISKRISNKIELNMAELIKSFKISSKSGKKINLQKEYFKEFRVLAKDLNKTIELRNKAEEKVKDYNTLINENIIISTMDKNGIILDISSAFCNISKYTKVELIGKHHYIMHDEIDEKKWKDIFDILNKGKSWRGEIKNCTKNKEIYWTDTIIHPKYENNEIISFTSIKQDITNKKNVEYLSITDELTKLYNRRHFNTKIEEELKRAKRDYNYISFLMLDIDYFKKFNDTYGHQSGDEALIKVANVLNENTKRASDFAFRLGGEEFGLIFTSSDKLKSLEFAKLIKEEIEELHIKHKSSEVSGFLTISIGVITTNGSEIIDAEALYKQADIALYKAKENGRNTIFSN